jgi:hypothetical protein
MFKIANINCIYKLTVFKIACDVSKGQALAAAPVSATEL